MSLETPKFIKINESFVCSNCAFEVPPSASTCRDHCPKCLYSLHVDVNPGDRAADCAGLLRPVGYRKDSNKGFMILYECKKCGASRTTRFLEIDRICPDDFDTLLKLTPKF